MGPDPEGEDPSGRHRQAARAREVVAVVVRARPDQRPVGVRLEGRIQDRRGHQGTPASILTRCSAIARIASSVDGTTLVFTPSDLLDPGKIYSGELNLSRLSAVEERLKVFPLRIQTLKKDFRIKVGALECTSTEGLSYILHGQIITSDFIKPAEAESYLEAKLGRKRMEITWDHSDDLIHNFTVTGITREEKEQKLSLSWDGTKAGVKQKGASSVSIPPADVFSVIDVILIPGESQRVEMVFSDPVDVSQESEGLIHFTPSTEITMSYNSNIISIFPSKRITGSVSLNVESSIKNNKGKTLSSSFITTT